MEETLKEARRAGNYKEFNLTIVYVRYVLVYNKMKRFVALNRKLVDSIGQLIRCIHAPISMYIFSSFLLRLHVPFIQTFTVCRTVE